MLLMPHARLSRKPEPLKPLGVKPRTPHERPKTMKSRLSMLALLILMSGCVSAPPALQPQPVERPKRPPLAKVEPAPDFIGRMDSFLQGKLPQQPGSPGSGTTALPDTKKPAEGITLFPPLTPSASTP